jgi:16S rRNA (adenine1518-N6/adenine1519-N6)-dimethyltransferase
MKKSRRHALGQHFLASPGILERIAAAAGPIAGETVLEIGSGKGALTLSLLAAGAKVVAVEKDPALGDELRNRGIPGLTVIEGDILDQDWARLMEVNGAGPGPYVVVGNLPYSISTPLLYLFLDHREIVRKGVFLVQREVAERYIAGPGGKDYSPLGILLQIYYSVKILFKVSPGSFVPPPKVDSAVISLERREAPLVEVDDFDRFRRFLHSCFAQRRKTLGNNLAAAGYPHDRIAAALASLGLDPKVRAEAVPAAALFQMGSDLKIGFGTGAPSAPRC